ncbi:MAG: GUN4 domain-containing protein [Limnospira sp. PMC 894.15]|uniref:GUN4 domain-containing protein n=1 Tax=unclassified Limnospira TaxID=2642885 RepID=UPI0028E1476E|nr:MULTISPECIES: GUN4 domain-containing protein [unclassified Limnospira]MDT9186271.1 GUN4 domain-containing protein [Limnospira sp. PMC 894.15]MDT9232131.1 GUN4 domain-containing protein [Limnospira sp. PMC 917.15]
MNIYPATNQPDQEPPSNPPDLKTPTSETKGEPPTNQPDQEPQVQEKIEVTINKINYEIEHDPDINQLNELKSQANSEAWNKLIGWVSEWILSRVKSYVNRAITPFEELLLDMDLKEAKRQVEELKSKFPDYPPDEIAKILIGQTCLEVAGISLQESLKAQAYVKEIDSKIEIAISMIDNLDFKTITNECAEMVYKIAMIYGFDMDNPIRIFEVLAAFGIAWLGNRAIDAGIGLLEDIGLLQVGFYGETTIRAVSKALMILTVGYAARQFYREKLKANELLKNQTAFKWVVKSSQNSELYNIRNDEDLPTIIKQNIMPQSPTLNTPNHKTQEQKKPPEPKTEREPKINRYAKNLSIKFRFRWGMDYSQLENLLKCGEWKASDKETTRIMLKLLQESQWCWFDHESIRCLPGEHLSYIDYLWKSNSGDRFGFSVQKRIYNALEGTGEYDAEIWSKFATKIGWKREDNWLLYCDLQFHLNAPKGHLPAVLGYQMRFPEGLKFLENYKPELD